jgi:hypothetical protein
MVPWGGGGFTAGGGWRSEFLYQVSRIWKVMILVLSGRIVRVHCHDLAIGVLHWIENSIGFIRKCPMKGLTDVKVSG